MNAIAVEGNRRFLFMVDNSGKKTTVHRTEVQEYEGPGTLKKIEPTGEEDLSGRQVVVGGVHYLRDGEEVNVAQVLEVLP